MIADKEIEQKAAEGQISPINVEKDYVYGWLLKAIYDRPHLGARLILKGGQALRKAYLPETRFSKDLDFSALEHLDAGFLESELREVCSQVTAGTGVRFLDKIIVKDKELPIQDVDALEVRLYFKGFYGEENLNLRAQLDVSKRAAGPVLTVSWTSDCYAEGREVGAERAYGDDVHSTVLLMKFHAEMGVSVRLLGFPESAGDTWRRT
jgi:hypothetical protein